MVNVNGRRPLWHRRLRHAGRTPAYRGAFRRHLHVREMWASPQSLFDLQETIRIDRGKCVARTYRVDDLMAMWLLDIGIVQFYDGDGNMLATINLLAEAVPQRMV